MYLFQVGFSNSKSSVKLNSKNQIHFFASFSKNGIFGQKMEIWNSVSNCSMDSGEDEKDKDTYRSLIFQIRFAHKAIENDIGSLMCPNFCIISPNEQFWFLVFFGIFTDAYEIDWVNNRFSGR